MESILDKPINLSIEKKFIHCVSCMQIKEDQSYKSIPIRKNTTNRCYFSEINIDGENVTIIFVSNGLEMESGNKRALVNDLIDSIFGARHQNYDRYYVSELDGKRCIVVVADEQPWRHDGKFNYLAREMAFQPGKACKMTFPKGKPHLEIEEENPECVSAKDVIENVLSYELLSEEMEEMARLLDEIIRLHTEIEKIDSSFFLPDELKTESHYCEEDLTALYQSYLETISRYTELENDVEDRQVETNLQRVEAYLNFLTAENLVGDMTIAKYFVCERRLPDDDVVKIHSLGPRDETIIVRMNHDKINTFIEGAKRLNRFVGYFPLTDIDYIIACANQIKKAKKDAGYQEIKEYIERSYNLNYHFIGETEDREPYDDTETKIGELRNIYQGDIYEDFRHPTIHNLANYVLRGYTYDEIKKLRLKTQDDEAYKTFRYCMRSTFKYLSKKIFVGSDNNIISFPPLKRLLRRTDIPIIGRGGIKKKEE